MVGEQEGGGDGGMMGGNREGRDWWRCLLNKCRLKWKQIDFKNRRSKNN